jgi:hypothetical protein
MRRRTGSSTVQLRARIGAATYLATTGSISITPARIAVTLGMRSTASTFFCAISGGNSGGYQELTDATIDTAADISLTLEGNPSSSDTWGIEYSYMSVIPSA